MTSMKKLRNLCSFAACLVVVVSASTIVLSQGSKPPTAAVKNLDVQLHLLLASNDAGEKSNLPQSLDPIVRQLKSSLSFSNFRLATNFVNRVKDGGTLESRGLIASNVFLPVTTNPVPQTAYEFTLTNIKLDDDLTSVDIPRFRFGLSIPVITGMTHGEGNVPATPAINYQPASINTEMTLTEGTPTVVGTMNTTRSDQMLILVITVKRAH
jgi:hypothetical protein